VIGRWRRRAIGLAAIAILAAATCLGVAASRPQPVQLTLRDGDGNLLLRLPVTDARFTLRYRNSIYGSIAEERFAVAAGGRISLVEVAADQRAVLGEYYEVAHAPRRTTSGDPRTWASRPRQAVVLAELSVLATDHGRRTLLVGGREPIPLWGLVDGLARPHVVLRAEDW
jgi:hypothetical protein